MRTFKHAVRAITGDLPGPGKDKTYIHRLRRFGEAHQAWWHHENVVGLCVARKRRAGKVGALAVQVLVRRKVAAHKLDAKHRVPDQFSSAAFKRPLRTDVWPVGEVRLESIVSSTRPAQPGFDIGNQLGGSGTLACVVVTAEGKRLGLSCAHVLAPGGADDVGSASSGTIICPSLANAEALDVVAKASLGKLVTVRSPAFEDSDATTNIDAALFAPDDPKSLSATIAALGIKAQGINDKVGVGLVVHKVGAASAETQGIVHCVGLAIKIPYGNEVATFVDHIGISSFTQPGDSGSLVLDEENRAVGMHIGAAQGLSICTPIQRILNAFQCELAP